MSQLTVTNLIVAGPMIIRVGAPITLGVSGVLTRRLNEPLEIVIDDGETLKGMIGQFANGDPLDRRTDEIVQWEICSSGTATIAHLDVGTPALEQISTYTGANVALDKNPHKLIYRYMAGAWIWILAAT